ncbi:hypothetical protein V3390_09065 [Luteimonas sp. FXH3W]|uniref:Uncharacterized protein n=1 Tax=Aquilutibacter rugosus TaxID=3115820 RepID=A0ABU7V0R6_9GAMM
MQKIITIENEFGDTVEIVQVRGGRINTDSLDGSGDVMYRYAYFTKDGQECEQMLNEMDVPGFGLVRIPRV